MMVEEGANLGSFSVDNWFNCACVCNSVVRNTIVGEQAAVENALVEDSLIGFQSRLKGSWGRFNISDLSEITT